MAKETTAARAADELFDGVTDDDKARVGFTPEELAAMDADTEADDTDDADAGEAEGEDGQPDAPESDEAEDGGEPEAETEDDGEADDGEADEAEDAEDAEQDDDDKATADQAEGDKPEASAAAPDDEIDVTDPSIQSLLDTRTILPSEWALPDGSEKKATERLQSLEQQAADLASKFDEGDLTATEYRRQSDTINRQIGDLRGDIRDAQRAFARAEQYWAQKTVAKFLRDNPEWTSNETMLRMLDGEVRAIQDKSDDAFDPLHLVRASRNLKKAMGLPAKAEQRQAKDDDKPKPNPVPKGKKPEIPPTLARVPNDEINDVEGGKYARLDRLASKDPLAYEDALAKLSPAERDAYLASA